MFPTFSSDTATMVPLPKSLPLSDAVIGLKVDPIEKIRYACAKYFNLEWKGYVYIRKNFLAALCLIKAYQYSSSVQNLLLRIYSSSVPQSKSYGYVFTVSALELKSKGGRLQLN